MLFLAAAVVVPHRAWALGEEEWRLTAGAGLSALWAEGQRGIGPDIEVEGARGLTDLVAARAALGFGHGGLASGGGFLDVGDDGAPTLSFGAGLALALDVLSFVPFVEAGLAGRFYGQNGPAAGLRIGVELGAGGDYLVARNVALGLVVRGAWLPLKLGGEGDPTTVARVHLRASYLFD